MARPPKAWPPVPRPHKASGQERVRWRGHDHYLGPIGSEEARVAYAELLVRLAKDSAPPPARPRKQGLTVAELLERWDVYARERYDPAGREAEQFPPALAPVLGLFGPAPAATFSTAGLAEVRDEMIRLGWCRRVVNRRVVRVRTVWRWAEQRGLVPEGRWAALRALAPLDRGDRRVKSHPPRQAAGWRQLVAVLRKCPVTVRDMLLCQWYTGMRPAEVRTLLVGEIDRTVRQDAEGSGEVWCYRPPRHKRAWREQERLVMIGPRCQALLRRRLEGRGPDEYVFESAPGRCYTDSTYPQAVARASEKAAVKGVTPYIMRHSYKARVTNELSLEHARAALGQASLLTTDLYAAGPDPRLASEAARRLG